MKKSFVLIYAWLIEQIRSVLIKSNSTMKVLFIPGIESLRFFNGKIKMLAEYYKAVDQIPAYKTFIGQAVFKEGIPETSKDNYVKQFNINDRCINGKVPEIGVIIDESSGSSGMPTQWVRGQKERAVNNKFIEFGLKQLLGDGPKTIINTFAMGSWATGINVSMASAQFARIKSTGPEPDKIEHTLSHFGKDEVYVLMGYPPFIKYFVDHSRLDLKDYNVSVILGGEAMTEGLRSYLIAKGIKKVYSSYGASDLELNIGAENDFTIGLRKLLTSNLAFRKELLIDDGEIPMIFQFNPADFFIETNSQSELIVTICRSGYIAPKIRYNIKDKGQVVKFSKLRQLLHKYGMSIDTIGGYKTDLPLLFHYGRTDQTVSFFGSNISPSNIQEVIFAMPEMTDNVNSFFLSVKEDKLANKHLEVHIETSDDQPRINLSRLNSTFFERLSSINQDFKEALRMLPKTQIPKLFFHNYQSGPFANHDKRIKMQYIR